ncbi:sensor histidine kinase [Planomonospora sp. ID67723]|uniref:sensor histidine kinase n=1 Tax=Planomonospora sp. ID67723 TaxID=2738134 RepID=UPI0018C38AE2|nr:histidine kinase [Planomonospora sp. ID67723]MBG0828342.1 sensor histidine kinase [Planomonospora sp. ID67723]
MSTNADEKGTGRARRLVPSAVSRPLSRPLSRLPAPGAGPLGRLLRRERRSQIERLRRLTAWMLGIGIVLAWAGPLGWLSRGARVDLFSLSALGLLALVPFTLLQLRMIRAAMDGVAANREVAASGAIALAVLATQEGHFWSWGLIAPAWAAGAALLLSRSGTLAASLGSTAVGLFLLWPGDPGSAAALAIYPDADAFGGAVGAYVGGSMGIPWANRFQLWFWEVVRAAEAGKAAQARLAVTEERLRFARDLHDLVGHSLSAIAVKSEVAVRLVGADAERAAAEMDEVRGLAREALKEIRTAVRGYRTVDLDAELRSMAAVLEAGGIRCMLQVPPEEMPEELATLLAWLVREGTTNVLRHSAATFCRISITLQGGTAVLEMTNDGVSGTGGRGGTGLTGMAERVAAWGGSVTAGADRSGEFRVRATVPLEGVR